MTGVTMDALMAMQNTAFEAAREVAVVRDVAVANGCVGDFRVVARTWVEAAREAEITAGQHDDDARAAASVTLARIVSLLKRVIDDFLRDYRRGIFRTDRWADVLSDLLFDLHGVSGVRSVVLTSMDSIRRVNCDIVECLVSAWAQGILKILLLHRHEVDIPPGLPLPVVFETMVRNAQSTSPGVGVDDLVPVVWNKFRQYVGAEPKWVQEKYNRVAGRYNHWGESAPTDGYFEVLQLMFEVQSMVADVGNVKRLRLEALDACTKVQSGDVRVVLKDPSKELSDALLQRVEGMKPGGNKLLSMLQSPHGVGLTPAELAEVSERYQLEGVGAVESSATGAVEAVKVSNGKRKASVKKPPPPSSAGSAKPKKARPARAEARPVSENRWSRRLLDGFDEATLTALKNKKETIGLTADEWTRVLECTRLPRSVISKALKDPSSLKPPLTIEMVGVRDEVHPMRDRVWALLKSFQSSWDPSAKSSSDAPVSALDLLGVGGSNAPTLASPPVPALDVERFSLTQPFRIVSAWWLSSSLLLV